MSADPMSSASRASLRRLRADTPEVEVEEEESPGRLLGMELVFLLAAVGFVLVGGGSLELGTTEAKVGLSALEPLGPFGQLDRKSVV